MHLINIFGTSGRHLSRCQVGKFLPIVLPTLTVLSTFRFAYREGTSLPYVPINLFVCFPAALIIVRREISEQSRDSRKNFAHTILHWRPRYKANGFVILIINESFCMWPMAYRESFDGAVREVTFRFRGTGRQMNVGGSQFPQTQASQVFLALACTMRHICRKFLRKISTSGDAFISNAQLNVECHEEEREVNQVVYDAEWQNNLKIQFRKRLLLFGSHRSILNRTQIQFYLWAFESTAIGFYEDLLNVSQAFV